MGGDGGREIERRDFINHSNQYCMSPLWYGTCLVFNSFYFNGL